MKKFAEKLAVSLLCLSAMLGSLTGWHYIMSTYAAPPKIQLGTAVEDPTADGGVRRNYWFTKGHFAIFHGPTGKLHVSWSDHEQAFIITSQADDITGKGLTPSNSVSWAAPNVTLIRLEPQKHREPREPADLTEPLPEEN